MKKRATVFSALSIFFLTVFACGMDSNREAMEGEASDWVALKKDSKAEDFTLKDINGKDFSLSDFRGKIVFLNFWATWCSPCREEMPSMEKLHHKFKDDDLVILALSTDRDGKKVVTPFAEEEGLTFTILLDSDGEVSDSYRVFGLPTTFIIGRDGTILHKEMGVSDWFSEESQSYFKELMEKAVKS